MVLISYLRTAAIKSTNGTVTQLAKISSSVELQELMQEWAKDPIALFPEYVSTVSESSSILS